VAINHTVSSLVPQNSYEDGVDFVVLKHRWRWKEEEDTTRAGRGGQHCCHPSRARQGTGGPRSRAMGRRLGPVPMLFSVSSRSCRERRRVVCVDDEGQFRVVHFTPRQTDRWHPHELFSKMKDSWIPFHFKAEGGFSFFPLSRVKMAYPFASRRLWILQWAGSCAWGNQFCLSLRKGCFLWVNGPTTIGAIFLFTKKRAATNFEAFIFFTQK
jgi:hypothetical protein